MKIFRPFLAIELESTGLLEDNAQILEIAMRYEDFGFNELSKPKELHLYVKNEKLEWCSDEIKDKNTQIANRAQSIGVSLEEAQKQVKDFINEVVELNQGYEIIYAAKNANTLVLPLLRKNGFNLEGISYRKLDIPSMYYMDFGHIPTFAQISRRIDVKSGNTRQDVALICAAVSNKVMKELGL